MVTTSGTYARQAMLCLFLLLVFSLMPGCGALSSNQSALSKFSSLTIIPSDAEIRGGDKQIFAAVSGEANGPNTSVIWSVNGVGGGNAAFGTIDPKGTYTAPTIVPNPNSVIVSAAIPRKPLVAATARVTVDNPVPMLTNVSPRTVPVGDFKLIINGDKFVAGSQVQFAGKALPTIFNSPTQLTATGTATAAEVGTVMVSVKNGDPGPISSKEILPVQITSLPVSVSTTPSNAVLQAESTLQFTASVSGLANHAVTWLVSGKPGGDSTSGTILPSGLYLAPKSAPASRSIEITAISQADPSKSDSALVVIPAAPEPVLVSLTPKSLTLPAGGSGQFNAAVTGTSNHSVTWLVNGIPGGNAASGTISAAGLYVAPAAPPTGALVTITATSTYDSDSSSSATVTLTAAAATGTGTGSASGITPPNDTGSPNHTYYVSNGGSDAASGTSSSAAWQTIAHVNQQTFKAGDSILFQSGGTWREQLAVPSSGTAGSPIVVANYGNGPAPIITGADSITAWTLVTGNVWQAPLSTMPNVVLFNKAYGTKQSSTNLTAASQWYWADNMLYVYSSGVPSGIEASKRDAAVVISNKSYITVSGIDFEATNALNNWAMFVFNSSHIILHDNIVYATGGICIFVSGDSNDIYSNTMSYCGRDGIGASGTTNSNFHENQIHHIGTIQDDSSGISLINSGANNNRIYQNKIHDNVAHNGPVGLRGIILDTIYTTGINYVFHNLVYNNSQEGINVFDSSNQVVYGNTSYNDGRSFGNESTTSTSGNVFYNNTAVNPTAFACFSQTNSSGAVYQNNLCYLTPGAGVTGYWTQGTGATTATWDHNLIYAPGSANLYNWGGKPYLTAASFFTATGQGRHDLNIDPKFIDLNGHNFGLSSDSPAIDAGVDLGPTFATGLSPTSVLPLSIVPLTQARNASTWDIGAYVSH